jgi:hypothetical protein
VVSQPRRRPSTNHYSESYSYPIPILLAPRPPARHRCSAARCLRTTGATSAEFVTDARGRIGFEGAMVDYSASIQPPFPELPGNVTVVGGFSIDGVPIVGVPLYSTFHAHRRCLLRHGKTDSSGTARCVEALAPACWPADTGECELRVQLRRVHAPHRFQAAWRGTPAPASDTLSAIGRSAAPAGICVVRTGFGDLTVSASFASPINTQPAFTTGQVVLGQLPPSRLPLCPRHFLRRIRHLPRRRLSPRRQHRPILPFQLRPRQRLRLSRQPHPHGYAITHAHSHPDPHRRLPLRQPPSRVLRFSFDAARVANPKNRGDKSGLDAISPANRCGS